MRSKSELVAFPAQEFPQTEVTIEAVGPVPMFAVMVRKGYADVARQAREYSGSAFWPALVRHLLRNMAGA